MNRVLGGHKYVANFLAAPVRLGAIYKMDDEQFIPAIEFNDVYQRDLAPLTRSGSRGLIKFSAARDVSISVGARRSPGIGESEVELTFKRRRSVAGVIDEAFVSSLRYVPIRNELIALWREHGFDKFLRKYVFVYEVVTAGSGTLIYSEEANNRVVLKHTRNRPLTKLADLGSGEFEYVSNSKRTLDIIRSTAHKPLFKAFRFKRRRGTLVTEILG